MDDSKRSTLHKRGSVTFDMECPKSQGECKDNKVVEEIITGLKDTHFAVGGNADQIM